MKASTRVVVNTGVQYLRTGFSVVVSLYTTRVILGNLGVNDFGIFNLVGGVVSMLAFIQNNLARSTQRFLAYYHGKNDPNTIRIIFNNSLITQLSISVLLCGVLLLCTPLIFEHLLNISPGREEVAHYVYYLALVSLFFNFQSTPYLASLIARENIVYSTGVQFIDTVLKIPIAFSLILISEDNRLTWYSVCMAAVTGLNYLCYKIYCRKKYFECQSLELKQFEWPLAKEMFSFMSWGIYGTFCVIGRSQGVSILLNRFYTTAVNAAFGLAIQVSNQLSVLAIALTNAINPQIIKAEGGSDRKKMFHLTELSCKYSVLLFSILAIPLLFFMDDVLTLWLHEVPEYTSFLCSIIIGCGLVDQTTLNLTAANQAIGNVKYYNIYTNTIKLLTVPVAYITLRLGYTIHNVMIWYLAIEALCAAFRLVFLKIDVNISLLSYLKNVFLRVIPPIVLNVLTCMLLSNVLGGWMCVLAFIASAVIIGVSMLIFSLSALERQRIYGIFIRK